MEKIIKLAEEKGYMLMYIYDTKTHFILKPSLYKTNLPKGMKPIRKPNFSYYPSIISINQVAKDDSRTNGFTSETLNIEFEGQNYDSEVIVLDNRGPRRIAELIYNTFVYSNEYANSIYEIVTDLENIFGLVWKIDKKFQLGLIGELLVIKENPQFIDVLLDGFHKEFMENKTYNTLTDFEIKTQNNSTINIEVKTTFSEEGLFTIKNSQLNESINDYYAAVKIKKVNRGGQTLIDLIEWYLHLPSLSSDLKEMFKDLKESNDHRNLIRFDIEKVAINFISIKKIPLVENKNDLIKNISFQIDLFSLENISIENILNWQI